MAEDKNDDKKHPDEESIEVPEELIEAEGPDIETSLTDDDLAFLAEADSAGSATGDESIAELVGDLKRVQAEFVNYRKRVERDREATRESNIAEVVKAMLPVLDDFALAEAHGDLTEGPMLVIAQKFRAGLEKFGLTARSAKRATCSTPTCTRPSCSCRRPR